MIQDLQLRGADSVGWESILFAYRVKGVRLKINLKWNKYYFRVDRFLLNIIRECL